MEDMKFDKSGGVAVMAALKAAAQLKLPINVLWPDSVGGEYARRLAVRGRAISSRRSAARRLKFRIPMPKAGWYFAMRSRMRSKQKVDTIVDIATLTGACMVALGKYKAGLMGNNDELVEQLEKAAETSGEAVWHLPSGEEYLEEMKSKIADLKNIGSQVGRGVQCGGVFGPVRRTIFPGHISIWPAWICSTARKAIPRRVRAATVCGC